MNRLALSVALLSLVGSLEGMKTLSQNVNISCISKDVFCSLESVAIPYCYNEDDFRKKYKNEKVAAAFVCGESSGCYYQGYYSLGVYHECQYIRRLLGNICEKLDFSKAEELIINRQDVVTVYF
ncbi:MAG: hypothetical protein LBP41_04430, partial [Holosporaceae bacterium]|nr:hypothetical protein [Holosporaceae bacterium]